MNGKSNFQEHQWNLLGIKVKTQMLNENVTIKWEYLHYVPEILFEIQPPYAKNIQSECLREAGAVLNAREFKSCLCVEGRNHMFNIQILK